jgi:hypothetical protein
MVEGTEQEGEKGETRNNMSLEGRIEMGGSNDAQEKGKDVFKVGEGWSNRIGWECGGEQNENIEKSPCLSPRVPRPSGRLVGQGYQL